MGVQVVNLKVSRHVFGSRNGYRTLAASDDLTPDEIADLESFAFGQTNDAGYLASLKQTPAYWSRQLSSGRRAITRVLPGPHDDQGRQSLRFITAVLFVEDWLNALSGEDTPLLQNEIVWSWGGQTRLPQISVEVAKPPRVKPAPEQRARVLSLLGLIETISDSPSTTVVVEEGDLSLDELRMVLALLPVWYRPQFFYAVRGLSESLPVQLNYLARGASRGKSRRKIIRWTTGMSHAGAKYASGLAHFWKAGESPPWEFVSNCRAFGRLLPTYVGTDVPSGTVAAQPTVAVTSHRKRARTRIPVYFWWILALAVVVGGTGLFVRNTIATRRHAETTLTAAEDFLAENADVEKLPAATDDRRAIIQKAETLVDDVAHLRDSSRADRQAQLGGRLHNWLTAANARTQEYGSLDDVLAGYRTYATQLGLDAPDSVNAIPDATTRTAVAGWKRRLEHAKQTADQIGGPYPERIESALNQVTLWRRHVHAIAERCQKALTQLRASLSKDPPAVLSNDMLSRWEEDSARLEEVQNLLPAQEDKQTASAPADTEDADSLEAAISQAQQILPQTRLLANRWHEGISSLKQEYHKYLDRAEKLITDNGLEFEPTGPADLREPWKAALDANAALDQAHKRWPDSEEVSERQEVVGTWMETASRLAIDYFESELDHAEAIWKAELERVGNVSTNGTVQNLPNPVPAKVVLDRAMRYWEENTDIIQHHNKGFAQQLHVDAAKLQAELMNAEARYKAALPTPTPVPGQSPPPGNP